MSRFPDSAARRAARFHEAARQRGFTLLEAVVALGVFALISGTLLAWINTNLIAVGRIDASQQSIAHYTNALALMESVNPMATPDGESTVEDLTVRWQAVPAGPERDAVNRYGNPGAYRIGLYAVTVTVLHRGDIVGAFEVRQVGYRRTGQAGLPEF